MAAPGPTYATFANTLVSKGFDFTFAPGVQPSVCMLYTVPHVANLPSVGTLTITTTGRGSLTFNNCLLEQPKLSAGSGGTYWQLPIKDRRWKWQFGAIYGYYNRSRPDGSYANERSPQQLASLLFAEMGEVGADWSRLPNTTRPEKRWDGANPAAELDALCAELGCVVTLNPFTDQAVVWPIGSGATLPAGNTIGRSIAPVLPAKPSSIWMECAETLFQATFQCEAVGMDTDGKWKPLQQLSYSFGTGFSGSAALDGFNGYWEGQTYTSGGKTLKVRDLAAATVFQCYRLKNISGWVNGFVPPILHNTPQQPTGLADFRFFSQLAEEEISTVDGGLRPLEAAVYARWARLDARTPDTPVRYPHGFSFDPENHIVQFSEPLFLWGGATSYSQPADVRFECSFYSGNNGVYHRHGLTSSVPGSPTTTPAMVVQHPEIQRRVIYRFLNDGNQSSVEDTLTDTNTRLGYWLTAELDKLALQQGITVPYEGLVAIAPDGLTQQVTWSGGGGRPATTTVSQAQRHNRYIPPLDEYRDRLAQKRGEVLLTQLATGQLLKAIGGGV